MGICKNNGSNNNGRYSASFLRLPKETETETEIETHSEKIHSKIGTKTDKLIEERER